MKKLVLLVLAVFTISCDKSETPIPSVQVVDYNGIYTGEALSTRWITGSGTEQDYFNELTVTVVDGVATGDLIFPDYNAMREAVYQGTVDDSGNVNFKMVWIGNNDDWNGDFSTIDQATLSIDQGIWTGTIVDGVMTGTFTDTETTTNYETGSPVTTIVNHSGTWNANR